MNMIQKRIVDQPKRHFDGKTDNRCILSVTTLRERSSVESFYRMENNNLHSSDPSVSFRTDVYMLFNQHRLDRMTVAAFSDYLNKNVQPSSPTAQLRSKMSDAQLHSFVKSRYIQSLGELQAWSRYLDSQITEERGRIEAAKADAQAQEPQTPPAASVGAASE